MLCVNIDISQYRRFYKTDTYFELFHNYLFFKKDDFYQVWLNSAYVVLELKMSKVDRH